MTQTTPPDLLAPTNPPDDTGDAAPSFAREGSSERLTVLYYLASRPRGAHISDLALLLGLPEDDTRKVLRGLQYAQRIDCARAGSASLWFSPIARAGLRAPQADA